MDDREPTIAFGPVGLAGLGLLLLGILRRSRFIALLGLGAVVADVTVAELGGFKALNETRCDDGRRLTRFASPRAGVSPGKR